MTARTTAIVCAGASVLLLAGLTACGDDSSGEGGATTTTTTAAVAPGIDPLDGGEYDPQVDPADFVERVDNRYLPLLPGTR